MSNGIDEIGDKIDEVGDENRRVLMIRWYI